MSNHSGLGKSSNNLAVKQLFKVCHQARPHQVHSDIFAGHYKQHANAMSLESRRRGEIIYISDCSSSKCSWTACFRLPLYTKLLQMFVWSQQHKFRRRCAFGEANAGRSVRRRIPNPYASDMPSITAEEVQQQWRTPEDFLSLLLLIGGDTVQRAIGQKSDLSLKYLYHSATKNSAYHLRRLLSLSGESSRIWPEPASLCFR